MAKEKRSSQMHPEKRNPENKLKWYKSILVLQFIKNNNFLKLELYKDHSQFLGSPYLT